MIQESSLHASYRFCSTLARREARNFYYAFLLLPPHRRRSMCALYAFLRHADDLADRPAPDDEREMALAGLRGDLDHALAGEPTFWPGMRALGDAARRHAIPGELLHQAIDGVLMDVHHRRFETFAELADYCHHVASVVGVACLHIWGYRSEQGRAESLAEHYGLALQLTNILRDVGEDARAGRIYLPREDLDRFGVDPAELAGHGTPSDRLRSLFEFQAARARGFYEAGKPLEDLVDRVGRPVLRAIVGIYRALLDEITRRDYRVLDRRVAIPPTRKLAIAVRSLCG